jgi:hypothetical protein
MEFAYTGRREDESAGGRFLTSRYHDEEMNELVFEVMQEADGGYCAECLTESIFTQAGSWDELRRNVLEA